jgi:hypothetical protein
MLPSENWSKRSRVGFTSVEKKHRVSCSSSIHFRSAPKRKKVTAITFDVLRDRSEIARARDAGLTGQFTTADPLLCAAESVKFPAVREDGRKGPDAGAGP